MSAIFRTLTVFISLSLFLAPAAEAAQVVLRRSNPVNRMQVTAPMALSWSQSLSGFFSSETPSFESLNSVLSPLSSLDLSDAATRASVEPVFKEVDAAVEQLLAEEVELAEADAPQRSAVEKLGVLNTVLQAYVAEERLPQLKARYRQYREQLSHREQAVAVAMVHNARQVWRKGIDTSSGSLSVENGPKVPGCSVAKAA